VCVFGGDLNATMMCCLPSDWFIVYNLMMEAEWNRMVNWNMYIYIFINLLYFTFL
jgi:hypothetical protein